MSIKFVNMSIKRFDKIKNFLQQVKQGPYYICAIDHLCPYQCIVSFFRHEEYQILIAELYDLVESFDEKLYICEVCHKHLNKNEIPCQVVCITMALHPMHNELKDFRKLEKVLISK